MNLNNLIEAGSVNPVIILGFAILLGSLHALEPGHSKAMMAAYIVAIRGTVRQAIILGASAALSHSIVVWVLATIALIWGNELIGEQLEPYFMMISGLAVLGVAAWMIWQVCYKSNHTHHYPHDHAAQAGHHYVKPVNVDWLDSHARAHAAQIEQTIAKRKIGTWQTILFGLSGGLIPCPAAITVFILCLNLKKQILGAILVAAFSFGFAVTLIGIGAIVAVGLQSIARPASRFKRIAQATPWLSAFLITIVGLFIFWSGWNHLDISQKI